METGRKVYTLRPYYIDYERLYDVYSTIMNGYSDTQEIVEITKGSIQKNRKLTGTGEFSVTSLLSNGLHGVLSGETTKENKNERELQIKSTRKLPSSVLLNWLLDKMEKDLKLKEIPSRWWHLPISLNENDLGQPVVLRGNIVSNSIKALHELNIYPKGIKGILRQITDFFTSNPKKKLEVTKKYILLPTQNYKIFRAFQDVRINFELLEKPEQLEENLSVELLKEFSMLQTLLSDWLYYITRTNDYSKSLDDILKKMENIFHENTDDPSLNESTYHFFIQLRTLYDAILAYENIVQSVNIPSNQIKYTFDLNEKMYYYADSNDILNANKINCFGIIKNIGTSVYELEVIALFI